MHDGGGGGGHFGGGHMGGHVGGHVGGHAVNPGHHHHGAPDMNPVSPGYLPSDAQRSRSFAAAGQRFAPTIAFLVFAVILAIVLLVV
jgi:hypothetical protein